MVGTSIAEVKCSKCKKMYEADVVDHIDLSEDRDMIKSLKAGKANRTQCPKCKKALMGKPRDPKTGKVKIRAKIYVCPACEHSVEKEAYEETLHAEIKYACPHCKKKGEARIPFKRKSVKKFDEEKQKKVAMQVLRVQCEHCGKDIDISKKMK